MKILIISIIAIISVSVFAWGLSDHTQAGETARPKVVKIDKHLKLIEYRDSDYLLIHKLHMKAATRVAKFYRLAAIHLLTETVHQNELKAQVNSVENTQHYTPVIASAIASSSSDRAFLECTKAHESNSAGGYRAYNPAGWYGAYQFDQSTWDSVAHSTGRDDLVGANILNVSPADQDAMATALYHMRGNQPWGGRC